MKTKDSYYLGYISKTTGFEGDVVVLLASEDTALLKEKEAVFVLIEGKLVPFFIEELSVRRKEKEAVIRFEDITDDGKARHLCERELYLPLSRIPEEKKRSEKMRSCANYKVFLPDNKYLGIVDAIIEYPDNPVFRIMAGDREILIPANQDLIIRTNHAEKSMVLNPPAGLIDLYL